jgi:adenosylcobyric acid synthase
MLPLETNYSLIKQVFQRQVPWQNQSLICYEIHQGSSHATHDLAPYIEEGTGWQVDGCQATYLHGLFDNGVYREAYLTRFGWSGHCQDWERVIDQELERLTELLADRIGAIAGF